MEREKIATVESTIEHERNRAGDLEQEIARHRRQLAAMSARAGDLQQQLRDTADSLEAAEQNHREVARRLAEAERAVTDLTGLAGPAARRERAIAARPTSNRPVRPRRWTARSAFWRAGRRLPPPSANAARRGRPSSTPRSTPSIGNWRTCAKSGPG